MKKKGKKASAKTAKKTKKSARAKRSKKAVATVAKKAPAKPSIPVKKRIVVTGATGFIGTHLCHELAQKGYHVIILTQGESKQTGHDNETTVHWNGVSVEALLPYVEGAFAVINLAGENIFRRWTSQGKQAILESRLQVGRALIQVLQKVEHKPEVFIQASAIGYYGSSDDIVDEGSSAGEGFLADVCGQWEASTDAAELFRIRYIIIRMGVVLGNEGGAFPKIVKPFRYCIGGPVGSGNQWFSYIHIMDEIRAIQFLLETADARGIYNLTAPHPCTNRQFSTAISNTVHRPMLFGASAFTMKLLFGQMATETVLASQRVIPKRLEQHNFHFLFPTVEQAVADLLKH